MNNKAAILKIQICLFFWFAVYVYLWTIFYAHLEWLIPYYWVQKDPKDDLHLHSCFFWRRCTKKYIFRIKFNNRSKFTEFFRPRFWSVRWGCQFSSGKDSIYLWRNYSLSLPFIWMIFRILVDFSLSHLIQCFSININSLFTTYLMVFETDF